MNFLKDSLFQLPSSLTEHKVKTDTETVHFCAGDIVVFPAALSCVWEVKKALRKHYQFG